MNKALSCRTIVGTSIIEIEQGVGLGSVQQVVVDQGVSLTFIIKTTDRLEILETLKQNSGLIQHGFFTFVTVC